MSVGRRFVSRFNPGRPAWLEEVIQPAYHRKTIASPISETKFFSSVTDNTPVDITPQLSASNGQIPDPKLFVVHGIRSTIGELFADFDNAAPIIRTFLYRTAFQFFLGEKFYLHAPLFLIPSGGTGLHLFGQTDAASPDRSFTMGFGGYFDRFSTMRVPITIPSRQLFYCQITPKGAPVIAESVDLWITLDGAFGREVA